MVSFDTYTTNAILTVAVVGLFAFFIILLMKLNPSVEKRDNLKTVNEMDREELLQTLSPAPQKAQPSRVEAPRIEAPRGAEKPLVTVGTTSGGPSAQMKQPYPTPAPTFRENREAARPQEKATVPARTEAFPTRRDCLHYFGYLRTFPKNSPIPDECFGCEKIVDCLVSNSKKSNGKNEKWR